MRVGETKLALEIMKLLALDYPESADAYLENDERDLARQHAEKALAILDSHTVPASTWSDTNQRRERIRHSAEQTLKKINAGR